MQRGPVFQCLIIERSRTYT